MGKKAKLLFCGMARCGAGMAPPSCAYWASHFGRARCTAGLFLSSPYGRKLCVGPFMDMHGSWVCAAKLKLTVYQYARIPAFCFKVLFLFPFNLESLFNLSWIPHSFFVPIVQASELNLILRLVSIFCLPFIIEITFAYTQVDAKTVEHSFWRGSPHEIKKTNEIVSCKFHSGKVFWYAYGCPNPKSVSKCFSAAPGNLFGHPGSLLLCIVFQIPYCIDSCFISLANSVSQIPPTSIKKTIARYILS